MKKFKLIGMALMAFFMCVNFTSCSKDDLNDDVPPLDVPITEKLLTKIVSEDETFSFSYDSEGHLTAATHIEKWNGETYSTNYQFIWGDDVIKVKENSESYTLTLSDGLVQNGNGKTFSYNKSNRFVKGTSDHNTTDVIWNGDKLVNIEDTDYDGHHWEIALTYGETCKNGYSPFIPLLVDFGCDILFMAHPEIVGMSTNQLPTSSIKNEGTATFTYEFDEDGYVSKIVTKYGGQSRTYTLTWK